MPSFVDPNRCDGCKGAAQTACMAICPNDLMLLDPQAGKAFNLEPAACWECYACVKICPRGAIGVRPYADIAPMGGACVPQRSAGAIRWTVTFRNGHVKRFAFPTRTTARGEIRPYAGQPEPGDLENELLCTERTLAVPGQATAREQPVDDPDDSQCWLDGFCR